MCIPDVIRGWANITCLKKLEDSCLDLAPGYKHQVKFWPALNLQFWRNGRYNNIYISSITTVCWATSVFCVLYHTRYSTPCNNMFT